MRYIKQQVNWQFMKFKYMSNSDNSQIVMARWQGPHISKMAGLVGRSQYVETSTDQMRSKKENWWHMDVC